MRFASFAIVMLLLAGDGTPGLAAEPLAWSDLAEISDAVGFAGSIVGVLEGELLVAGGANFPGKPPWQGGAKQWHDRVLLLDSPGGKWRPAGQLPRPVAYSVCATTPRGVAVLGGSSATGHSSECYLLQRGEAGLVVEALPPLPLTIANACGGQLAGRLYLAGGIERPDAVRSLDAFYSLDLEQPQHGWRKETTWPGVPRMLATAAVLDGAFYLVGGVALDADEERRPRRTYLRDAYKFVPASGWTKIADLPWPLAASPSPAPVRAANQFLILGGDDGRQVAMPPQEHSGFRREVLAYNAEENRWTEVGVLPLALVTTSATQWRSRIVVPGGEVKPGVRSTRVLSAAVR